MKGFRLFSHTNSRGTFNLASWHSPHSLTWRWVLSWRRHTVMVPTPHFIWNSFGLAVGLGAMLALRAGRDNNGWQWSMSLLWRSLDYVSQRPMWYRDLYMRERDERDGLTSRRSRPEMVATPQPTVSAPSTVQ